MAIDSNGHTSSIPSFFSFINLNRIVLAPAPADTTIARHPEAHRTFYVDPSLFTVNMYTKLDLAICYCTNHSFNLP